MNQSLEMHRGSRLAGTAGSRTRHRANVWCYRRSRSPGGANLHKSVRYTLQVNGASCNHRGPLSVAHSSYGNLVIQRRPCSQSSIREIYNMLAGQKGETSRRESNYPCCGRHTPPANGSWTALAMYNYVPLRIHGTSIGRLKRTYRGLRRTNF